MSDETYPSYRIRSESAGAPFRMLAMAGGVVGVLLVGGLIGWGFSRGGSHGGIPVVEPDPRPLKVRPDDPGGLHVANQDEIIFDRRPRDAGTSGEKLGPEPEMPNLDRLRAEAMPPVRAPAPLPVESQPVPASPVLASPVLASPVLASPVLASPASPAQATINPPQAPAVQAVPGQPRTAMAPPAPAEASQPAAVRPAAPPATPVPAVTNGRVQIQLGALNSEEAARGEWARLTHRAGDALAGRHMQVTRLEREGQATLWRLRTGGFADLAAAKAACEQLKAKGAACEVIP